MSHPNPPVSAQRLVFPEKQKVILESFEPDPLADDQVLVRTALSLMSTGTENIVFNRLFDAGTHWDNWVKYPFYPGYTSVGVVEAVGKSVTSRQVGDRVALRGKHASHFVVAAADCYPIPDQIPFDQATWIGLAKIAFHGARRAEFTIGDNVLVIGAGPIGQMTLRWARALGVGSLIVVDGMPSRLALAKAGGATATIAKPIAEAREEIIAAGDGQLPRVIIDTTGNAAVFAAALGLVANRGRLILLGDTGRPSQQTLTSDVLPRGLTIVGVHDSHNTPEWHEATITSLLFKYIGSGRLSMEGMNTHVFKPEQCMEAYTVANRDRASTMGILFDWTASPGGK